MAWREAMIPSSLRGKSFPQRPGLVRGIQNLNLGCPILSLPHLSEPLVSPLIALPSKGPVVSIATLVADTEDWAHPQILHPDRSHRAPMVWWLSRPSPLYWQVSSSQANSACSVSPLLDLGTWGAPVSPAIYCQGMSVSFLLMMMRITIPSF